MSKVSFIFGLVAQFGSAAALQAEGYGFETRLVHENMGS